MKGRKEGGKEANRNIANITRTVMAGRADRKVTGNSLRVVSNAPFSASIVRQQQADASNEAGLSPKISKHTVQNRTTVALLTTVNHCEPPSATGNRQKLPNY